MNKDDTLEGRLRAVEDKLAIFHLIASHPPAADTGSDVYYRDAFVPDGVIDRRSCSSSKPSSFHSTTSRCRSRLTCRLSFSPPVNGTRRLMPGI